MIGCLMIFPLAGFFVAMAIYMASMMVFLSSLATAMGIYMGGMMAFFTAFFMIMLG